MFFLVRFTQVVSLREVMSAMPRLYLAVQDVVRLCRVMSAPPRLCHSVRSLLRSSHYPGIACNASLSATSHRSRAIIATKVVIFSEIHKNFTFFCKINCSNACEIRIFLDEELNQEDGIRFDNDFGMIVNKLYNEKD